MPRTPDLPNAAQIFEVARLFYVDELTKQVIAERLRIDARKVTALLKEARDTGVVRITLHGSNAETDLEQSLRAKFPHLQKVIAIPGPNLEENKYPELLRQWAVVAANYFDELIQNRAKMLANRAGELHVGIAGGETMLEFVKAVPEQRRPGIHIHATAIVGHGLLPMSASHVDPSTNATILWINCGRLTGHCHYATATPYDTKEHGAAARTYIKRRLTELARNKEIETVLERMEDLDIAFMGLGIFKAPATAGAIFKNRLMMMSLLQPLITSDEFVEEKVVGDLCYSLIDENGNSNPKWQFFLTAGHGSKYPDVKFYRNMVEQGKTVVVIAGRYKLDPIRAALKGKLFNVWITDELSARQILKETK